MREVAPILLATAASLLVSYGSVELFARFARGEVLGRSWFVLNAVGWAASYLIPAWVVVVGIFKSLGKGLVPKQRLTIILASYASIVLAFSGMYYSMSGFADYYDAVAKYRYYGFTEIELGSPRPNRVPPLRGGRAFRGIEWRLWSGVDWQPSQKDLPPFRSEETSPVSVEEMIENAKKPFDTVLRFVREAKVLVSLDSLHLSVVTMATLGYGDISPRAWYAKLATDVQVLSAVMLFVVALGMLFGRWWDEDGRHQGP